jgi:hypothetical protein
MGWPFEWPDHPDTGHFVIQEPTWILDDNSEIPVLTDEFILVPASSVEMVEILRFRAQTSQFKATIDEGTRILTDLRKSDSKSDDDHGIIQQEDEE